MRSKRKNVDLAYLCSMKNRASIWGNVIGLGTILAIVAVIIVLRPKDPEKETPPYPPEEMAQLMLDLHHTDAWVDRKGGPLRRRNQMRSEVYDEVLASYGLDRETFGEVYAFYLNHPSILDTVYGSMVAIMQNQIDSLKEVKFEHVPVVSSSPDSAQTDLLSLDSTLTEPTDTAAQKVASPLRKLRKAPK